MALTGLDIFKLTPKTNCKDCGFPTCLAFSMKVATGGINIDKCPHMSSESLSKLSDATAPPMKTVVVGKGDLAFKLGGETVLFRHEKTFVNRSRFAVILSDSMTDEHVEARLANINKVNYIRIGEEMKVEIIGYQYDGNREKFLGLIQRVIGSGIRSVTMLVCDDPSVVKDALALVMDENPIVCGATKDNYKEMVDLVKNEKLLLGVSAESLEELYTLVEEIQKLGHRELLLNVGVNSVKDAYENAVQIRRIALKEGDRTFGYPSIVFANELSKGNKYLEISLASTFIMKYGSIIVLEDMDYIRALPLFALRQNIFTDPQRPMKVEQNVYPINNADENAPVLVTVDFALTYFIVSGEIERSKVPVQLAIPDAGGYSVLTAWAAGKFGGSSIAKFIKESGLDENHRCKKLVLPGKVAVLKGDVEENLPGWEVIVGPDEAMHLPKFLKGL